MFCSKCGNRLTEGAKFCEKCGNPVPVTEKPLQEQSVNVETGTQIQTEAAAEVRDVTVREAQVEEQPGKQPEVIQEANAAPAAEAPAVPAPEPESFSYTASNLAGERILGALGGSVRGTVSNVIPGPGKVISDNIKSFFTSVGAGLRQPKKLIPVIVIAVIWIVLNILKACGINPFPLKILSFLTFAEGGTNGGIIGAIAGIAGKAIFAGALTSLIGLITRKGGQKRSFGETIKGAFGVTADTLWIYLTGMG